MLGSGPWLFIYPENQRTCFPIKFEEISVLGTSEAVLEIDTPFATSVSEGTSPASKLFLLSHTVGDQDMRGPSAPARYGYFSPREEAAGSWGVEPPSVLQDFMHSQFANNGGNCLEGDLTPWDKVRREIRTPQPFRVSGRPFGGRDSGSPVFTLL